MRDGFGGQVPFEETRCQCCAKGSCLLLRIKCTIYSNVDVDLKLYVLPEKPPMLSTELPSPHSS